MPAPYTVAEANIGLSFDTSRLDAQFKAALATLNRSMAVAGAAGGAAYGRAVGSAIENSLRNIQALIGVGLGVEGIRRLGAEVVRVGAMFDQLGQRMQILTGTARSVNEIVASANRMGMAIEDSAQAFGRIAVPARELGLTSRDIVTLHQTLAALGRIGGTTAGELRNALYQITQAMAAGRLGGDELRSMMENMALAAQMLARELGVGVGQLRTLGEQGKITGDVLVRALIGNAEQVLAMFDKLPPTIEQVHARLSNAFTVLFDNIDKRWQLSAFYKEMVQGVLVEKINALARAIEEGGRPTLRDEEMKAAGFGGEPTAPVRDRAAQVRQYLATGVLPPTEEDADRLRKALDERAAQIEALTSSAWSSFERAVGAVLDFLGIVTHRVGEFKSLSDRLAAMRLESEFSNLGATLASRMQGALIRGQPSTKQDLLPTLRDIMRDVSKEFADWPHPELTEPHLAKVREIVEQQASFLADTQKHLGPALEQLAQTLEEMPLTKLLRATGHKLPDFRQILSRIREQAEQVDLPIGGEEFAKLAQSTIESLLQEMKKPLDAMRDEIRDVEPWKLWVGTTKAEWEAAIAQAGNQDLIKQTMMSLADAFVQDTMRRFMEARTAAARALADQINASVREAIKAHATEIASSGLPAYLASEEAVTLGVDLGREPARKVAVLDAQRQRYVEIQNVLNAVNVAATKAMRQADAWVRGIRTDANEVLNILDEMDVALDELRAVRRRVEKSDMLGVHDKATSIAQLNEAEERVRKATAIRVAAIRDKTAEQLINEIENITHAAEASTRRLLSDHERILYIDKEREAILRRLFEIEEALAVAVEPKKTKALEALATAREAVVKSANLKIEDVRFDAAKKALDEMERITRALEEAENRFLAFEDKRERVNREIDAYVARATAARERAAAARPEDKAKIEREYAALLDVAESSRLRRIEGLRMEEAEPALRAIERMRELKEANLLATTKERTENEILEQIEQRRLASLRELAKLQETVAARSEHLTAAQRFEGEEQHEATRRAIEERANRERVAELRRLEREAIEDMKRIVQIGERAEASAASRLPIEERIAFYQNEQKEALEEIDRLYQQALAKATQLDKEERKLREAEAKTAAETAKAQVQKAAADREAHERAKTLAEIEKDIQRIRRATMRSQSEALGIEEETERIEEDIRDTLQQILLLRRQLVVLGEQDRETLAAALDTLEQMVVASRDVRVAAVQEAFAANLAKKLEQIENIGRAYERSVTRGTTGEDLLREARERYERAVAELDQREQELAKQRRDMTPVQAGNAAGTIESTRIRIDEAFKIDLAQIRERVEQEIREANRRALLSLAQAEMRVVPIERRLALADEETKLDLERYTDLRKKLSVFTPDEPEQAATLERMKALIDEAERARRLEGEYRKRKLLEEWERASQRAADANEEVLRDLDDLMRTIGDERERFIARFTDRLTKTATPEQWELVRKKAGEVFDREKLAELTHQDIPRLTMDLRREELALAREKGELTREQYELELAMLQLRERQIPLDAKETAAYLELVKTTAARMEAIEEERKQLAFAQDWAGTIVDGLVDITTKADDAADAVRKLATELANLTIRYAVLDPAAKALGVALNTGFTALSQQLGIPSLPKVFGFAGGGIMSSRGPVPIPAGRLASPVVGVFGEGAMAEAAVPLPDGRNIPVDLRISGPAGGASVTNISIDARASIDPALVAANAQRAAAQLINYMQRRGGLR
jgi:tape measure domain-containing protein